MTATAQHGRKQANGHGLDLANEPPLSPPHNIEAERALLGALLIYNEALDRVSSFLAPVHFYDPLHGQIYETLTKLIQAGKQATPVTLKTYFENSEPINAKLTVPQYLGGLAANATTIINVKNYAELIRDLAKRREMIVFAEDLLRDASNPSTDTPAAALLAAGVSRLAEIESGQSAGGVELICATSFEGLPVPPRAWHVKDLIPHRNVTLLSGDGGTGKSLLALQLGVATAMGLPWLGKSAALGPVLYVGAEDDLDEMQRRLADITAEQGVGFDRLSNLHIHCLAGEDALLATFDARSVMTVTPIWRRLCRFVDQIKPRLVVFDTLADLFGGDEINRMQARQFVQLLRGLALRSDLAALLLAHPSVAGMKSGTGTSGSTGWSNSVRSRLYLERVKEDGGKELDPDARTLTTKKANHGPTGAEIALRWSKGVLKTLDGDDAEMSAATHSANIRAENAFLELLATYTEQGRGEVSPNRSRSFAPKIFAAEDLGKKIGEKALLGAMSRLLNSGKIRVEKYGPPSRRYSKLVVA